MTEHFIFGVCLAMFAIMMAGLFIHEWYKGKYQRLKHADEAAIFFAIHKQEAPKDDPSKYIKWLEYDQLEELLKRSMFRIFDQKNGQGNSHFIMKNEMMFADKLHSEMVDRRLYSTIGVLQRIKKEYYGEKAWLM